MAANKREALSGAVSHSKKVWGLKGVRPIEVYREGAKYQSSEGLGHSPLIAHYTGPSSALRIPRKSFLKENQKPSTAFTFSTTCNPDKVRPGRNSRVEDGCHVLQYNAHQENNPVKTIGSQVAETTLIHERISKFEANKSATDMLPPPKLWKDLDVRSPKSLQTNKPLDRYEKL